MHLLQIGVGSGGVAVFDLLLRDPRVSRLTLIDPDSYQAHNVHRHLFPVNAVGRLKVELARDWARAVRPDLPVEVWPIDVTAPAEQVRVQALVAACDVGVCAVDGERAKHHTAELFRQARKPWSLGEVLSGGVGGWVHRFHPDGPCYACVASYLGREIPSAQADPLHPPADYADPAATIPAATIPASKASIAVIASLQALVTLELVNRSAEAASWLVPLAVVPEVFPEAFRARRVRVPRDPACLVCASPGGPSGDALDAALDDALDRLA